MKKQIIVTLIVILLSFGLGYTTHFFLNRETPLPKPEITEGIRGVQFGIDKNINEETIDRYLLREDSVYRDMRLLIDEANYECIGGDSTLSGILEGFEAVPFPRLVNVTNLPPEIGETYQGPTLFTFSDGVYTANYEESLEFLETFFPKDKNIFLMCGGGGYAGMMKEMLVELGWNEDKIYNVGGHWYYTGNHNIQIKNEDGFDFWKITYHDVDFESLTPVNP